MLPFSDNIVTPALELMRSGTTPADGIEMASSLNGLDGGILDRLYKVIESRRGADPAVSNTARLFAKGTEKIAQKVGEEAVETLIEGLRGKKKELAEESADLLYHLLVLWAHRELLPAEVWAALARREGISGVEEKKSRKI
jgi:phosphoribosyl-ATP pyrophosphohydrolase